jgi:hypothetical protein
MLAPGDGEAEPGVTATKVKEPAKPATDAKSEFLTSPRYFFLCFVCRPLRGLVLYCVRYPRLGFAIAWG